MRYAQRVSAVGCGRRHCNKIRRAERPVAIF